MAPARLARAGPEPAGRLGAARDEPGNGRAGVAPQRGARLGPPLAELGMRLEHGIKEELLPLIRLRGVGRVRARVLYGSGLRTPKDLQGGPIQPGAAPPR